VTRLSAFVVVVVALTAVGCGGSDGGSSETTATHSQAQVRTAFEEAGLPVTERVADPGTCEELGSGSVTEGKPTEWTCLEGYTQGSATESATLLVPAETEGFAVWVFGFQSDADAAVSSGSLPSLDQLVEEPVFLQQENVVVGISANDERRAEVEGIIASL
jgi:hypothetical protein